MLELAGRRLLQVAHVRCFVHHVTSPAVLVTTVCILDNVVISALHVGPASHVDELLIVVAGIEVGFDTRVFRILRK